MQTSQPTPGRENDQNAASGSHPFDYAWQPGLPLRPPPPRIKNTPRYFHLRKFLLTGLRDVQPDRLPESSDDYIDRYNDQFWEGDPLMDAVVDAIKRFPGGGGKGRKLFDQALKDGIENVDNPPPEFVALFEQLDTEPDWLDWDRLDRGARIFSNLPTLYATLNGIVDLVFTTNSAAVSLATGSTGRFKRNRENRFIESFTLFTTMAMPGGMRRYGRGFATAVHVRLMHAFVRHAMRGKQGLYDYDFHGDPISSADSLPAGPLFGLGVLLVMRAFGMGVRRDEMEDVDMLFRYMVYVMGGHPNGIAQTLDESLLAIDYFFATLGEPSQFSDEMNRIFFRDIKEDIKARSSTRWEKAVTEFVFTHLVGAFVWHMFGETLCRELKYVKRPTILTRWLPRALTTYNRLFRSDESFDRPYNEGYAPEERTAQLRRMFKATEAEAKVTFQGHDATTSASLSSTPGH